MILGAWRTALTTGAALALLATTCGPAINLASANAAQRRNNITGFLEDGAGTGTAASACPGCHPDAGDTVVMVGSGAWQIIQEGVPGDITLKSAQGLCIAGDDQTGTGELTFQNCNGSTWQEWHWPSGFPGHVRNDATGTYLCAMGGAGSGVQLAPLANCSSYHDTWDICSNPYPLDCQMHKSPARKDG